MKNEKPKSLSGGSARLLATTPDEKMFRDNPDPMAPASVGTALLSANHGWEYRSLHGPRLMDLNPFGAEGWELISVIAQPGD